MRIVGIFFFSKLNLKFFQKQQFTFFQIQNFTPFRCPQQPNFTPFGCPRQPNFTPSRCPRQPNFTPFRCSRQLVNEYIVVAMPGPLEQLLGTPKRSKIWLSGISKRSKMFYVDEFPVLQHVARRDPDVEKVVRPVSIGSQLS